MRFYTLLAAALLTGSVAAAQTPTYNFYYGNLHSHSGYSDGNQDSAASHRSRPRQDYAFADASLHLDFLGISEHNHAQAGMRRANYAKGFQQADSATVNGSFVALFGMEWGVISGGGHMLVYGVPQLLGWEGGNYDVYVPRNDYQALMRQINRRPGAFALFAHPQSGDYGNLAGSAPFSPTADSALVGTPLRSGPATSTNVSYSNPYTGSYESTYRTMLAKGYHVGISLDHDNHNTTFGRSTAGRLVVLAPALTRPDLMAALRARRFYASDDWNTQATLSVNSQPMGSIVSGSAPVTVNVTVADPDNEGVRSITLMRGVPGSGTAATSVATAPASAAALTFADPLAVGTTYYYYAVIIQNDGDRIVTSPVWYTRVAPTATASAAPASTLSVFPNPSAGEATVSYYVAQATTVRLEVLDALGRVVAVLADGTQPAGPQAARLTAADQGLAPGTYIVRLVQDGQVEHRRLVIQ